MPVSKAECTVHWDFWAVRWRRWCYCEGYDMDIDLIFKIAGTGIITAVLSLVLKKAERDEQAMMTTLAGLIVVLMLLIDRIGELFGTVKAVFGL